MNRTADIAIVGAGPAGARAAELLASLGADVALIDAKAPWEKPCGGGLTPPAFREIPELEELKPVARPVSLMRVETGAHRGFTVDLDHPMWVLPRRGLGEWQLMRALRRGAAYVRGRVEAIGKESGSWRLETSEGRVSSPVLVGADGAASLVRRVAAPGFRVELAPTRVVYPRTGGPTPDTIVLRFFAGDTAYLWDFPRPNHRSIGVMVSARGWQRTRMDREIDGYRASAERCACPALARAGAVIGTAWLGHGDFGGIGGDDFALLGDAAGLADPFTGEGIQNAMRSSGLLAEAWADGGLAAYPALARQAFEREFRLSRLLRRRIFETGAGVRLVERAATSGAWYAMVAAIVNGLNEHDPGVRRTFGRWAAAYRSRRGGTGAPNEVRRPVPCGGRCSEPPGGVKRSGTSPQAA